MKIALGCDEAACEMKELIKKHLHDMGHETDDFGTFDNKPILYPDVGFAVAEAVAAGKYERAILLCGTGIGMSICANKVPGVRAALCHDTFSAERARLSNDAQVLTMGARVIGPELAKTIVDAWMSVNFEGGRSVPKVDKIKEYDAKFHS